MRYGDEDWHYREFCDDCGRMFFECACDRQEPDYYDCLDCGHCESCIQRSIEAEREADVTDNNDP
jgi:hypothetical protein